MKDQKILHNRARCLLCGDTIESLKPTDLRKCSCGNLSVIGGQEYIGRSYKAGRMSFVNLIEYKDINR